MSVQWEVTLLSIHTSEAGTSLFANGQMQVAANVLIKAINPANYDPYMLTAAELARIELVDYYNTDEKLTGPWRFTSVENEFSHTMPPGTGFVADVEDPPTQPLMVDQSKRYWVSTTKAEVKSVGARIAQPNGKVVTTRSPENDSYIAFRGYQEIRYSLSNSDWWREDTDSGSGWDQDNYFLRSRVHPFIRADRTGYKNDSFAVVGMRNSVAYHRAGPHLHYMWPMGARATVKAGLTHYADGRVHPKAWSRDIVIRQHANSLCLTRLKTAGPLGIWEFGWWYYPTATMYDQYGNSGAFELAVNEYNEISIHNRGTKSQPPSDTPHYEDEKTIPGAEIGESESSAHEQPKD
ncbi:hypothetical protein EAF00_009920 [Botryotinia globosa]|nr:hypothetical protein EAF00_009920 [Botryotinia globosa]